MAVASITGGGDFRVGDVMGRAWRIFIGNPVFFLAVPVVTYIVTFVLALVFGLLFVLAGVGTGSYGIMAVGIFLAVIVVLSLTLIGQGVLLLGAFQRLRGQPLRVGEAVQRVLNRFVPLAGLSILWSLVVLVTVFVISAIVSGLAALFGGWALVLVPVAFAVPAFLLIMWAVGVPVCIVEGLGPIGSMSRSADLSKGFRWKIFGIVVLLGLLLLAGSVVQLILGTVSQGLSSVVGLIWTVFWTAYFNCTIIMTYHDLRVAKEGVDTEQIASVFD